MTGILVLLGVAGVGLVLAACLMPAVVAAQRGYSFFYWLLLIMALNPLIALFVLAALPDRTLDRRRSRERELLDQQLAHASRGGAARPARIPGRSIGDASTIR